MSIPAIAAIIGIIYGVVVVFTYALMKVAGDADDAIERWRNDT